jgi:V/A-type H+-transporting ATPase subunit I
MIIPMKKAVLVALKEDKEALLVSLQRVGEMMLVPPPEDLAAETDAQREEVLVQRAEKSLQLLKK